MEAAHGEGADRHAAEVTRRGESSLSVRFACIGDLHERLDRLQAVVAWLHDRKPMAVLMVGDFTHGAFNRRFGTADAGVTQRALDVVSALDVPVLFVPGNHDDRDQPLPGNVDGTVQTVEGVRVAGIGGAGPARMGFPYEWSEEEIRAREVHSCDVLLSHAPPARTRLDVVGGTRHVGSEAVRERAERQTGVLVCGHIHESSGAATLGRCLCYNTGSLGEPFGRVQVGVLDIDRSTGHVTLTHHDLSRDESWTEYGRVFTERGQG